MIDSTGSLLCKQFANLNLKSDEIQSAIRGRAIEILQNVARIPADRLDGQHHDCPNCNEADQFKLVGSDQDVVLCNRCFNNENGDAISAVMHFRKVSHSDALKLIAEYLRLEPTAQTFASEEGLAKTSRGGSRPTKTSTATLRRSNLVIEVQPDAQDGNANLSTQDSINPDPSILRNEIYGLLLSELKLAEQHREELRQRKLADEAIDRGGYGSVISTSCIGKASRILRTWTCGDPRRLELALSVPGVVKGEGDALRFSSPNGLLIPVRDISGRIVGLRVRLDSTCDGSKYRWISSRSNRHRDRPSPGALCHVPLGIKSPVKTLRLTEGELNAEIAFALTGVPTISISGSKTWKRALPLVAKIRPEEVFIAPDSDFRTNHAAAAAIIGLQKSLSKSYVVGVEIWDPADGKAIDDILSAGRSPKLLVGEELAVLMTEIAKAMESPPSRTEILIGTDEYRVNDEVVVALSSESNLFTRGGSMVRIVGDDTIEDGIRRPNGAQRIQTIPLQSLRELITKQIQYLGTRTGPHGELVQRPVHPPGWCVSAIHVRGTWPSLRPLRAIVTCPIVRPDGSILSTDGYDQNTGLYLSSAVDLPQIPTELTQCDAVTAMKTLLDIVSDFPFSQPEHQAAWLAFALTPLARYAFSGPSPLFLIDANTRGSGKSLLADLVGIIATGSTLPRMSNPKDDEECRKRITALALAGDSMILIDNIVGNLGCASLDAALTAPDSWKDRILGRSEIVELPLSLTWVATGNNVMLEADTSRRTVHIRLDSPEEKPELRSDFQYPDLVTHVKNNRAKFVAAGLTILSAYYSAGRPRMNLPAWGSFDKWSALIREVVVWCGLPDPGRTREELSNRSDVSSRILQTLISQWPTLDPKNEGMTSAEMLRRLKERRPAHDAFREAICELCESAGDTLPSAGSLGSRMRQFRGRLIGGKSIDSSDQHGKACWKIRSVQRSANGCFSESGCSQDRTFDVERTLMVSDQ